MLDYSAVDLDHHGHNQQPNEDAEGDHAEQPGRCTGFTGSLAREDDSVRCRWRHTGTIPVPRLGADVTVAGDDVGGGRELGKTHGPAGMQLLSGDADLSTETKLTAVGEPGRSIHHDRRRVDT